LQVRNTGYLKELLGEEKVKVIEPVDGVENRRGKERKK
jgi:hypothetical protein